MAESAPQAATPTFFGIPRELRNHIYTKLHRNKEHSIVLPWKDEYRTWPEGDQEDAHPNDAGLFESHLTITPLPDSAALQINSQSKEEYKEEFYRAAVMKLDLHEAHEMLTPALMRDVQAVVPTAFMANLKHFELMLYAFSTQVGREDSRLSYTRDAMTVLLASLPSLETLDIKFYTCLNSQDANKALSESGYDEVWPNLLSDIEKFGQACTGLNQDLKVDAYAYAHDRLYDPKREPRSLLEWQALSHMNFGRHYPWYRVTRAKANPPNAWHEMEVKLVTGGYFNEELFEQQKEETRNSGNWWEHVTPGAPPGLPRE